MVTTGNHVLPMATTKVLEVIPQDWKIGFPMVIMVAMVLPWLLWKEATVTMEIVWLLWR
jgi:hypothetical protein